MTISRRQFLSSSTAAAVAASTLPRIAYTAAAGDPDVIVIGAGLSGLETTLALEENGLRVLLLEGRRDRVGGRVYSLFNLPGHPEVGGNSIAGAYGRMIAAAQKHKIEIVNIAPRFLARMGQELFLGGEHIALKDWPAHPRNPFAEAQKKLPPWAWADAMVRANMPFKDLESWSDPKYAQYDVSMHDFLARAGATEAQIRLGYDTNIGYGTSAQDVSLLMQAFSDHWQQVNRGALPALSHGGQLGAAASAPATSAGPASAGAPGTKPAAPNVFIGVMKDGNQNMPIAMARAVRGDRLMGKRVVAIEARADGAKVTCSDGTSYRAKAVVCTMPFATLRHVAIDPVPPALQRKAIQTLGYTPITQFHLIAKKPFWRDDGLAPSMWSDGLTGLVLAQRFGKTDDEVTSITSWQRGLNAQYVDRLGVEGGKQAILAEFAKLRPASKGKLEVAAVHSWALDPFAAGDFSVFAPGQVREFAHELAKPHERLFFAGEHTAVGSRGMEGALESAERVAFEVLSAIG